jgi:hypothetical protein
MQAWTLKNIIAAPALVCLRAGDYSLAMNTRKRFLRSASVRFPSRPRACRAMGALRIHSYTVAELVSIGPTGAAVQ